MRRVLALLMIGLIAGGPTPAGAATPPSWSQDGYGPGNTGYNPDEKTVTASTVTTLKPAWQAKPRAGDPACEAQTVPVAANGLMIVFDGDGIAAADLATGAWRWRRPGVLAGRTNRFLSIADGAVIAGGYQCADHRKGGGFVALDLMTGATRWTTSIQELTQRAVVDAGTIVSFATLNSGYGTTGYRASDGGYLWYQPMSLTSPVSAAGRILLTGRNLRGSTAVEAATGKTLWSSETGWVALAANPAGDRFYVDGPGDALVLLNAATGKQLWSAASAAGPLAADPRRVYVARDGAVTAYDAKTGGKLWRRSGVTQSRPIVAGGLVYVAGVVLSAADGSVVRKAAYGSAEHHAVVVDGKVLRVDGWSVRAYAP